MKSNDVRSDELPAGAGSAPEVTPVPAASVILLRGTPIEVLFMRRHERSSFVPNTWVFPGGIAEDVDRVEGDELATMKRCAVRELFEETGVLVDSDRLVWTARWITPIGVPKRFDTYFFLAEAAARVEAKADEQEAAEVLWLSPREALARHGRGVFPLVFPTIKNLEAIADFTSARDLIESRRGAEVRTTRPLLLVEGEKKRIILPDE